MKIKRIVNNPIQRLIKEEVQNFVNEEYADNLLYGYHVTYKENVENIFKNGLRVGGAEMQGKGLYGFYYLDYEGNAGDAKYYATKTNKDTAIIKFSVNPRRILIFDPEIAKEVLGDGYLITDQIKRLDTKNTIEQSAKMKNMSVEDFEKKINTKFLNNERNWWTSDLIGDYQNLGSGRLFNGEYGMTYVITYPQNLDLVGYYDVTYTGMEYDFSNELKTVKDNTILDIINKDDTYNNLKTNIDINQLESISDINKLIYQFEEIQMNVRNNREYDLYGGLIDDLNNLKIELQNQSTDTTDYSKIRGIA